MLNHLHEARKRADYDLTDDQFENVAQVRHYLELAHELFNRLQTCSKPVLATQIKAEMEAYRKKLNIV